MGFAKMSAISLIRGRFHAKLKASMSVPLPCLLRVLRARARASRGHEYRYIHAVCRSTLTTSSTVWYMGSYIRSEWQAGVVGGR
jgi:hypothetical protein